MRYSVPQTTWYRPMPSYVVNDALFSAFNGEIDHVFDEFGRFSSATAARSGAPRMNVSETDTWVEIEAELPGVEEKDVEVVLNDDVLTIKGEKRMESSLQHSDYCHQERTFGKFSRSITLPFGPDPKSVKTLFSQGVLKITLPKSSGGKQHTVKIPFKSNGLS